MTAFSRTQGKKNALEVVWEIKSVNHRFLDLSFRLPDSMRFIEMQCRSLISKKIGRGRVEINLQLKTDSNSSTFLLNQDKLNQYLKTADWIANHYNLKNDITVKDCFNWSDIWKGAENIDQEELTEYILSLFNEALNQLIGMRTKEGSSIQNILTEKAILLKEYVSKIGHELETTKSNYSEKIAEKISLITPIKLDEQKLEQELAVLLMKLDIHEELDRLSTHLDSLLELINHKEQLLGRKLDFIVQELHRETNTISSKTDSRFISQISIEMKVLIEQLREQIQNVE